MITIFNWHHAYYVPWAKGALNRHVPGSSLVDNANTEEPGYRSAIRWWRDYQKLGSSPVFDEATQNSLIKADQTKGSYIGWVQTALTIAGFTVFSSGFVDSKTKDAIRRFQKTRMGSKNADGIVGPKTETALMLWSHTRAPGRMRDVPKYNNYIDPWKPTPPEGPFDGPAVESTTTAWVGVGTKISYSSGVGPVPVSIDGQEYVTAGMKNLDTEAYFGVNITSQRTGFNLGGSAGVAVVVITGIRDPHRLERLTLIDTDFSLSLGAKLSSLWKAGKLAMGLDRAALAAAVASLKAGGQLVPQLAQCISVVKKAADVNGIDRHSSHPACTVVDIAAGVEISAYEKSMTFNVWSVTS